MPERRPLNILQISSTRKRGGSGASAMTLVKKLYERGHNVIYVCRETSLGYRNLYNKGVKLVTSIEMKSGFRPTIPFIKLYNRDIQCLRKIVLSENIDVIHTHSSPEGWRGTLAVMKMEKKPAIVRTRHIVVPVRRNSANLWMFNHMTDAVITVAETIKQNYFDSGEYNKDKIITVYDGVDVQRFDSSKYERNRVRDELGLDDNAPLIAVIARIAKVKGQKYMIGAMKDILEKFPDAVLIIAGPKGKSKNAGLYERLVSRTMKMGIKKNVRFLGLRKDIPEILAASDVFVLPSIGSEGSSRGTLEAMAMGKPCVTTKVGILPELVEDGVTGILVEKENCESIAQAVTKLLSHRQKAIEMGEEARRRILSDYSDDVMVKKIEDIYYNIIEKNCRDNKK